MFHTLAGSVVEVEECFVFWRVLSSKLVNVSQTGPVDSQKRETVEIVKLILCAGADFMIRIWRQFQAKDLFVKLNFRGTKKID